MGQSSPPSMTASTTKVPPARSAPVWGTGPPVALPARWRREAPPRPNSSDDVITFEQWQMRGFPAERSE